jgi:hypothetical protein
MALAEFKPSQLVARVLAMSIDGSVRTQDAPRLLGHILSRRDTGQRGWHFVQTNWRRIRQLYPEEMIPHVVSHASSFNSNESYRQVKAFLSTHRVPSGKSIVARTLERIEINLLFKNHAASYFNKWLNDKYTH